jgi:hypothetical protein
MSDEPKSGGNPNKSKTVTVACRLPHGMVLRLFKMVDDVIPSSNGPKTIKRSEMIGEPVTLLGYTNEKTGLRGEYLRTGRSAFALTHGVNRDFFEEWLKQNHDNEAVKKGLIFMSGDAERAKDEASEKKSLKNGLEPLDPKNLPRLSRNLKVETANAKEAA